jgi:hypothetical protein
MATGDQNCSWENDLVKGKSGEDELIEQYRQRANGIEIKDVRHLDEYRKIDVDFLFGEKKIEIKSTYWSNNRLPVEIMSSKNTNGWLYTCEADSIIFYDLKTKNQIVVKLIDLKNYYKANRHLLRLIFTKTRNKNSQTWESAFVLIELSDLDKSKVPYKRRNFNKSNKVV